MNLTVLFGVVSLVVWVLLALVFLLAGVAKLRVSGAQWFTSDFFALSLRRANYPLARVAPAPLTTWGLPLARCPWACRALAVATVLLELSYGMALFSRRLRYPIVLSMLAMLNPRNRLSAMIRCLRPSSMRAHSSSSTIRGTISNGQIFSVPAECP